MSKPLHILRRMRRKKSTAEVKAELDMTSMIDVVFLLLIFFMCATKFRQPEGALRSWLPRDRGQQASRPVITPGCRITLTREGSQVICLADDAIMPFAISWPDTDVGRAQADFENGHGIQGPNLEALEQHILGRKDTYRGVSAKGLPLIIDFGETVPSRYVIDVVNICKRLEIDDIAFAAPELPYD